MKKTGLFLAVLGSLAAFSSNNSIGAPFQFTVDPLQSYLVITPTITAGALVLTGAEQGPGSFTAHYSGSILADVTGSTIQILPTTNLVAGISGAWKPGTDYSNYPADAGSPTGYPNTSVAANYGVFTDLTALGAGTSNSAVRNLQIALSDGAPKALTAGTFDEAGTTTDFTAGTVYYSTGAPPPITDLTIPQVTTTPTVGTTGTGIYSEAGGVRTLTIPVSFQSSYNVSFLVLTTKYDGVIVATSIVPEPGGLALVVAATASLCAVARRRRRLENG